MKRIILTSLLLSFMSSQAMAETAYDRVLRTNILRCGYILWPLSIEVDPNTGAKSGMNYEFVNKLGEKLNLKVEWTQEVLSGQQVETLKSGKIDAICASEGPLVLSAARYLAYTDPIMWGVFWVYVRADDKRFDRKSDRLNQPDIKFSVIDGDNSDYMARSTFPKAEILSLPASADASQLIMNVATKKADVVIADAQTVSTFLAHNPGKLRRVEGIPAVGYIPNTLSVLSTETELLNLLNVGVMGVHSYGDAEVIFKKYEAKMGGNAELFARPALPFRH